MRKPSLAGDSHIAFLAYSDRCPPYIDMLHPFASSSKVIYVVGYQYKTEEKISESYTHFTGKVGKKK